MTNVVQPCNTTLTSEAFPAGYVQVQVFHKSKVSDRIDYYGSCAEAIGTYGAMPWRGRSIYAWACEMARILGIKEGADAIVYYTVHGPFRVSGQPQMLIVHR